MRYFPKFDRQQKTHTKGKGRPFFSCRQQFCTKKSTKTRTCCCVFITITTFHNRAAATGSFSSFTSAKEEDAVKAHTTLCPTKTKTKLGRLLQQKRSAIKAVGHERTSMGSSDWFLRAYDPQR